MDNTTLSLGRWRSAAVAGTGAKLARAALYSGRVPVPSLTIDPAREEAELRAYLGDGYDHDRLQQYQPQLDREFEQSADEDSFYRTSQGYLYNLTAFAMTGTKLPYLEALGGNVPAGARLLDYGCGIGSDGLLMLEAGYRVEFADFDNPSTAYLRWRLERRGLSAPIHDVDRSVPAGFDAAYAFDVIEHVPDAPAFFGELESRAQVVAVNLLEPEPDEQDLHHELPIGELLRHIARHRLLSYHVYYGRSHLPIYSPERVSRRREAVNRGRMAIDRVGNGAASLLGRSR